MRLYCYQQGVERFSRWAQSSDSGRTSSFTPAEVRKKIENAGSVVPHDKEAYSTMCEIGVHPNPTHIDPRWNHQALGFIESLSKLGWAILHTVGAACGRETSAGIDIEHETTDGACHALTTMTTRDATVLTMKGLREAWDCAHSRRRCSLALLTVREWMMRPCARLCAEPDGVLSMLISVEESSNSALPARVEVGLAGSVRSCCSARASLRSLSTGSPRATGRISAVDELEAFRLLADEMLKLDESVPSGSTSVMELSSR